MLDLQELIAVLQQHGFESASLTRFALFETGASYRLTVKGMEAMTKWQTLRGLVDVMGYWPVIVSNYENVEEIMTRRGKTRSPQDLIKEGLRLNGELVLRQYVE